MPIEVFEIIKPNLKGPECCIQKKAVELFCFCVYLMSQTKTEARKDCCSKTIKNARNWWQGRNF